MRVLGITGSIGMGKSVLARQCAWLGVKTCHADDIVHRLLAGGGAAIPEIRKYFPEAVKNGAADRKILAAVVFSDPEKRWRLEQILHPLVFAQEKAFIRRQRRLGAKYVALDIPLLFETGSEYRVDAVIVATAPAAIQRARVLRRPGMTQETLDAILRRQLPDRQKRRRADFVVHTGLGKAYSMRALKKIMAGLHA